MDLSLKGGEAAEEIVLDRRGDGEKESARRAKDALFNRFMADIRFHSELVQEIRQKMRMRGTFWLK
jgi:hypothetical protein